MEKKNSEGKAVALLHSKPQKTTRLGSNMCKMRIKFDKVYIYDLIINPPCDPLNTREKTVLVKSVHKKMKTYLGHYVQSGNLILSLTFVKDSMEFCSPEIEKSTNKCYHLSLKFLKSVDLSQIDKSMSGELQGIEMILSILMRDIMNSQKYTALTRNRFFDLSNPSPIRNTNLFSVKGYFMSASILEDGIYLTLDTAIEYLRKATCLDEIKKMKYYNMKDADISRAFQGKHVCIMNSKGSGLRMQGVDFGKSPISQQVEGGKLSLLAYWENKYHVKITEPKQPLLYGKRGSQFIYMIPELCRIIGIEEETKQIAACTQGQFESPKEKFNSLKALHTKITNSKNADKDSFEFDSFKQVPAIKLDLPKLSGADGKKMTMAEFRRGAKIMQPINFTNWLFVYEKRHYDYADNLLNTMKRCSTALGIMISEPEWMEMGEISENIVSKELKIIGKKFQFVFLLLQDKRKYREMKGLLDRKLGIISQFANVNLKNMTSMSFASNVIRQINAKLGGDLYSVELPKEIPLNTMFVGIDVCHCGKSSVVGFYSNKYNNFSKCYADSMRQSKGQEIVEIIGMFMRNALKYYEKVNKKLPDYSIVAINTIIFYI